MFGWILGVPAYSELEESSILGPYAASDWSDMDTGVLTFTNVFAFKTGDEERRTSVRRALESIAEAEYIAPIWESREGSLVYRNRHWRWRDMLTDVDATILESEILSDGFEYTYGRRLANDIIISYNPRALDTGPVVLGTTQDAIKVKSGQTVTVTVRYEEAESGGRVGGQDIVQPVAGTDWNAYDNAAGSGSTYNDYMTVTAEEGSTSSIVTLVNGATQHLWAHGLQIRGAKLTDWGQTEVAGADNDSISRHGTYPLRLNLPLLGDTEVASGLLAWCLYSKSTPGNELEAITVLANRTAAFLNTVLALTIGDRIAIAETHSGIDSEFHIIGEHHIVQRGGRHDVKFYLEPAPTDYPVWFLGQAGYGELGLATYLGY
jgi:hypothetical protein